MISGLGERASPAPVKLIVGLIVPNRELAARAKDDLINELGKVDDKSEFFSFDFTDYYEEEMGSDLMRQFLSFQELINPGRLAQLKLLTNDLEDQITCSVSFQVDRAVNLDPGYVAPSKLVLATTKNYSHRVYLHSGIYAEVTLQYRDGSFIPWEWTYPDYRTEKYLSFFNRVRDNYLQQLRNPGQG